MGGDSVGVRFIKPLQLSRNLKHSCNFFEKEVKKKMGDKGKKDINKQSKQAKAKKEAKNKKQVK